MRLAARSLFACTVLLGLLALAPSGAGATELCGAKENPCAAANVQEAGAVTKWQSPEALVETSSGTIACKSSTLETKLTTEAGRPLPGQVIGLGFGECKTGATACTVTAANLPYYTLAEQSGENKASLTTKSGGTGAPAVTVVCGAVINCTMSSKELALDIEGGKPGKVVASKEPLERAGPVCPKEASLKATYSASSPEAVHVAQRSTKLCKVEPKEGKCPSGQAFAGTIEASLEAGTEAEFELLEGSKGTISCDEAELVGTFAEDGTGSISSSEYGSGGGACTSTVSGYPTAEVTQLGLPLAKSTLSYRSLAAPPALIALAGTTVPEIEVKLLPPNPPVEPVVPCRYRYRYFYFEYEGTGTGAMALEAELIAGVIPPCSKRFFVFPRMQFAAGFPRVAEA